VSASPGARGARPELAHPDVARLAASLAARPGRAVEVPPDDPPPRAAAVALVLRVEAAAREAPSLLFVKRAEWPGDPWSGHVAFPGGRHEPGDATLWDTGGARDARGDGARARPRRHAPRHARRPVSAHRPCCPPIVVRPHVVAVPAAALGPLTLSDELAAAFWVPVRRFGEPGVETTSTVHARGHALSVPSFVHEGHVIWGMTERILRGLLARMAG
jgi:8-oxo-dGTP pyrophosphatase MutT (NUDIX family)